MGNVQSLPLFRWILRVHLDGPSRTVLLGLFQGLLWPKIKRVHQPRIGDQANERPILGSSSQVVRPARIQVVSHWWLSRPERSLQLVNKQSKRILRVVKWAVAEGLMRPEAHLSCKCVAPPKRSICPAPEASKITTVQDDRVNWVLSKLSPMVADMIRLQRTTETRPREVCSLMPSMIDRSSEIWKIIAVEYKIAYRGK